MELSKGERLIIAMMCDLFEHLEVRSDFSPSFIREAISGGHYWALDWEYGNFAGEAVSEEDVRETGNIMDMFDMLQQSFDDMPEEAKVEVRSSGQFAEIYLKFRGFDRKEGRHWGVADMLVNKMDRFRRYQKMDLDSHSPVIDHYLRMLGVFLPIRKEMHSGRVGVGQMIEILAAGTHPDFS